MIVSNIIHHEFVKQSSMGDFLKAHERHATKYSKAVVLLINDQDGNWEIDWSSLGLLPSEVHLALSLLTDKIKEQMKMKIGRV